MIGPKTVAMLAVTATIVAGALEASSQTSASSSTPAPTFEVASIRANKSGDVNRRITIPSPEDRSHRHVRCDTAIHAAAAIAARHGRTAQRGRRCAVNLYGDS